MRCGWLRDAPPSPPDQTLTAAGVPGRSAIHASALASGGQYLITLSEFVNNRARLVTATRLREWRDRRNGTRRRTRGRRGMGRVVADTAVKGFLRTGPQVTSRHVIEIWQFGRKNAAGTFVLPKLQRNRIRSSGPPHSIACCWEPKMAMPESTHSFSAPIWRAQYFHQSRLQLRRDLSQPDFPRYRGLDTNSVTSRAHYGNSTSMPTMRGAIAKMFAPTDWSSLSSPCPPLNVTA